MDDVQYVLWHFLRRERSQWFKVATMIAFGIPLSFLGPLVLATMFWFVLRRFEFGAGVQWFELFLFLAAVMVPLLYRMEVRSGGHYLSTVFRETDVHCIRGIAFVPGSACEVCAMATVIANPRAVSSVFVELFLWGPRMALGGFRRGKLARGLRLIERKRAALIVALLLKRDGGVESTSLVAEGETKEVILPLLAYLLFHQWVGVGKKWERVWLDSEARRLIHDASNCASAKR